MSEAEPATTPLQEMDFRQLQLYARDLQQLFWSERQARAALAEEKLVLEYKVRELGALNTLFQASLREKRAMLDAYQLLMDRLKALAEKKPEDIAPLLRQLVCDAEANRIEMHQHPQSP